MKKCSKCKIEKDYTYFSKDKSRKDGFSNKCKNCYKEYQQQNPEIVNRANKKWSKNNRDQRNKYFKNKKITEPLYKLRCNISTLICKSLRQQGFNKKSKSYEYLGCTFEEFKKHIENQFKEGMSWENRNLWHLDHIHPISLAESEEEIIKLNHYTNFQPLWAKENIRKGNRLDY